MTRNPNEYSFLEHLDELRTRLIRCLLAFVAAIFIAYPFSQQVLNLIIKPVGFVIFAYPAEAFTTRMAITLALAFFLSLPFLLYELWKFIGLGLTQKEKGFITIFGPFSLIMFLAGSLFGFFVILPISMKFFLSFSSEHLLPMISVHEYISFVGTEVFSAGIVFELPLVMLFLIKIGIATPAFLEHQRKIVIVLIFIVSAILTPPDVASQMFLAIPCLIIYELGILLAKFSFRQEEKK